MKIAIELDAKMIHDFAMEWEKNKGSETIEYAKLDSRLKDRYRHVAQRLLESLNAIS